MNILSMLSVLGYAVSAVDAKWTKRSHETERWEIARETNGVMNMDPTTWTPKPTAVPGANLVEMELMKRAGTSTCGYYAEYTSCKCDSLDSVETHADRNVAAAVICQGTAQCIVNDLDSAVGCCRSSDAEDCTIPTACLPSQIASLYSDANAYTILW